MVVRGKVASRGLEWCFIPSKNMGATDTTLKPQTNSASNGRFKFIRHRTLSLYIPAIFHRKWYLFFTQKPK